MIVNLESVRASAAKAALNPALWSETLWQVGQLVGSDFSVFDHIDKRTGQVTLGFTDRPDHVAEVRERYEAYFHRINPRFDVARRLPLDTVMHDDHIGDDKTISGLEFYADFLKPSGLKYFIGSGVADDAEQTVVFSLQRSADRGRASEEQKRHFAAILPDLRNATAIHLRMARAPSGAMLAAAFDRLADPLAVVREDGRLVFANLAMRRLLAAGDIFRLWRGALEGAAPRVHRALASLYHQAGRCGGLARTAVHRPDGPLILRLAPLERDDAQVLDAGKWRCFCLIVDDPARPRWAEVGEAMALFGFTRREAVVGTHLAAGLGVDQIAARLGVSRNTVRSHLAMLREKLGVRSALAIAAEMRRAIGPFA